MWQQLMAAPEVQGLVTGQRHAPSQARGTVGWEWVPHHVACPRKSAVAVQAAVDPGHVVCQGLPGGAAVALHNGHGIPQLIDLDLHADQVAHQLLGVVASTWDDVDVAVQVGVAALAAAVKVLLGLVASTQDAVDVAGCSLLV